MGRPAKIVVFFNVILKRILESDGDFVSFRSAENIVVPSSEIVGERGLSDRIEGLSGRGTPTVECQGRERAFVET